VFPDFFFLRDLEGVGRRHLAAPFGHPETTTPKKRELGLRCKSIHHLAMLFGETDQKRNRPFGD
jgi:hypothetical protein